MRCRELATVALISLALCAAACGPEPEWRTALVYRLEGTATSPPTAEQVGEAVRVVERRLDGLGDFPFAVSPSEPAGTLRVELGAMTPADDADAREAVVRIGALELRIRAKLETEVRHREAREAGADPAALSAEFAWVPLRTPETFVNDILVHTPERPLAAELEQLRAKGAAESSPEVTALRTRYEETVRSEVFTGADLESLTVTHQGGETLVAFEIVEARKFAFADFTERHVGRQMAIVIGERVEQSPVIHTRLPGRGIIQGGGDGFTEREGRILCSVLSSGAIPGRLVLVSEERIGTGESEPAPKAAK